ncbi:MAG: helix-turn-helix transcriptional regulator [Kineosporiaceae bacterium]
MHALDLLGALIATGRRERGWTAAHLAERLGVHPTLIAKIESGSPTTAIGTVVEAAVLCGVPLFDEDPQRWDELARRQHDRLAVLPARVRPRVEQVDDDF